MRLAPRSILVVALFAILATASATAQTPTLRKEQELTAAGHKPLGGSQVSTMLVGNTAYFLFMATVGGVKAGTVTPAYFRDARTRVLFDRSGKKVAGNWWVDGNLVCAEQQYIAQGHVCFSYYRVDAAIYVCHQPDGACNITVRVVLGNPENM